MTSVENHSAIAGRSVPDINQFVLDHQRLPKVGDEVPPWEYRGWLLWYCQLGHQHPKVVDRWSYYLRTLEAGRLLDDGIPQITFSDTGDDDAFRMLNALKIHSPHTTKGA